MILVESRGYSIHLNWFNIRSKIWRRSLMWLSLLLDRSNLYSPHTDLVTESSIWSLKSCLWRLNPVKVFLVFSFEIEWIFSRRLTSYKKIDRLCIKIFCFSFNNDIWREVPFSFKFQNIPVTKSPAVSLQFEIKADRKISHRSKFLGRRGVRSFIWQVLITLGLWYSQA